MDVMFYTDGKGNWWRTDYAEQCKHNSILSGRCQAVKGHKGYHWSYSLNGSYKYHHNDDDPQEDAEINACGMRPPGSKKYVPPGKNKNYHMNFKKHYKVTDKKEIERLEKGKFKKNESVNRPLLPTDEHYDEVMKRVKRSDEIMKKIKAKKRKK